MILRSAFALAAGLTCLLAGVAGFADHGQAQPYPPQGYQSYGRPQATMPYRPIPGAAIPDDDDDIPENQIATPGNYPPPPGARGAYVEREALPPPGAPAPYYGGRPPAFAYGDRNGYYPPPPQPYGGRPIGNGQPESYGAAPQQGYLPNQAAVPQHPEPYQQGYQPGYQPAPGQGPMQLVPRPPADVSGREPTGRDATGSVRPNTVATLPPDDQPETGKPEISPEFKRQIVNFQSNEPAGTLVIDTAHTFLYLVLGHGRAVRFRI